LLFPTTFNAELAKHVEGRIHAGCVSALIGLQCHLCKTLFPAEALSSAIAVSGRSSRVRLQRRAPYTRDNREAPEDLWRYRELLPITGEPRTGFNSGSTPLVPVQSPADHLGVTEL
jgi:threonine synthase